MTDKRKDLITGRHCKTVTDELCYDPKQMDHLIIIQCSFDRRKDLLTDRHCKTVTDELCYDPKHMDHQIIIAAPFDRVGFKVHGVSDALKYHLCQNFSGRNTKFSISFQNV